MSEACPAIETTVPNVALAQAADATARAAPPILSQRDERETRVRLSEEVFIGLIPAHSSQPVSSLIGHLHGDRGRRAALLNGERNIRARIHTPRYSHIDLIDADST